jgi:heterodisulfide reductase subunit B
MKEYAYFPGCSLEKIAQSYNVSTIETTSKVGIELKELEDWNCCGATAYFHVDEILAYTLCVCCVLQEHLLHKSQTKRRYGYGGSCQCGLTGR